MIESLMFSIVEIRSDIVFAILVTTFFAKNQSYIHIKVVKTIFKYLKIIQD